MAEIIYFNRIKDAQENAIEIERTEDFYQIARELDGFIKALPISQADNDKLIEIIIRQVQAGEQGAFNQGFRMGSEFEKYRSGCPKAQHKKTRKE